MIPQEDLKKLASDPDGLKSYEYIANNISELDGEDALVLADNIIKVDVDGQFCASAARFMHAVSSQTFSKAVDVLVASVIDKDREHKYLADLMSGIYGEDYASRKDELFSDNNFRRIYKRLFPNPESL